MFSSLPSWSIQLLNKQNSDAKRRKIQFSRHFNPLIPKQIDLPAAPKPVPVHLAVSARNRIGRTELNNQKFFQVVRTNIYCAPAYSLFMHRTSVNS
jgi:hypothetical protein